jgi:uncharacterized protein with PIN domain
VRESGGRDVVSDWPWICVGCKDAHVEGRWMSLASYFADQLEAKVTFAVCPACSELRSLHGVALLDAMPLPQRAPRLTLCTDCKRILDASGAWRHAEDHLRDQLRLRVVHTVCPRCTASSGRA